MSGEVDGGVAPRRAIWLVALLALALAAGFALASYLGWLSGDLEELREESRRARERYEQELEEQRRAWATAAQEPSAPTPSASSAPATPLSTLSCKEAHERFAGDAGPPRIDPELERKVKNRLSYGTYLTDCHVPGSTRVLICATIVGGVAEGVTVQLTPPNEDDTRCIDRAVRTMTFPVAEVAVVATTRFQ